jgi:N-acetyl-gamma-glutamyl-phosphate reductase
MRRVHVWGAAGYAAAEAIRWLQAHPFVELGALESRSHAGQALADHFSALRSTALRFDQPGAVLARVRPGDVVIAAGGHGEAITFVLEVLARGALAIDLSADHRFDAGVAYGLSEWHRDAIAAATLVANPGCYPTATLLALLPLAGVVEPLHAIVDAKSGITGAGRTPSVGSLYAEVAGDIRAYGLAGHRHQPEIERLLAQRGIRTSLTFTPHVVPLARGMLVDAYLVCVQPPSEHDVHAAFERAYRNSPFVRVLPQDRSPSVAAVVGTNDAELRVDVSGHTVRVICAIDNLGKGAAGQAVQNLNIMLGFPEETGLNARAIVA